MHGDIHEFSVDDHLLLIQPERELLFLLNSSAAVVWETFAATSDPGECAAELANRYGIPRSVADADVRAALDEWREHGLIGAVLPARLPDKPPISPEYPQGKLPRRYFRLGQYGFSIEMAAAVLEDDLLPRVAHLQTGIAFEGGRRYAVVEHEGEWAVWADGSLCSIEDTPYKARVVLLHDLIAHAYGHASFCVMHAAVIAHNKKCVVVAGETGAGKSTLSVAAMLDGLQCRGDDCAPVTRGDKEVAATPFGIMLREPSWGFFPQLDESLSPISTRETGRVRYLAPSGAETLETFQAVALVFIERTAAEPSGLLAISRVEAITHLKATGFWITPEREAVVEWLSWIERTPRYVMHYEDCASGVKILRELLQG